ncbi:MAG: bifunctional prephenate dehydrogenase/3-phosphoshikimate 1-carboxyvinyltransferase [Moraxellaceae bacterium]|nr:bifunctional prephenate dehydrogenase/3-phosphoshikimate 1-carboxyvinyltransferase [Moraxellaceae bacterium]
MKTTPIPKTCIIGLGLIGASFVQALKDKGLINELVAVDKYQPSLDEALADGLISQGSSQLSEVVQGCKLIIIAVPVKAVDSVFNDIYQVMQDGLINKNCIITDVCSTKGSIINSAKQAFHDKLPIGFVPAHPIAGAEHSGYHARNPQLFQGRSTIICEIPTTEPTAIDTVSELWQAVGAKVMPMGVEHHDGVFALTSHLPHLLAFALVDQLASHDDNMNIFRYGGYGFRDFTRIAGSDPTMWHDIFFENEYEIIDSLDKYIANLQKLRHTITNKQSLELMGILERSRHARRHFEHMLASTPYTQTMETNNMTSIYNVQPSKQINGTIKVAGDKSISHRSIMFGSLANGTTHVTGFLEGEDAMATLQAFRDMGVVIENHNNGELTIHGVGINGLKPSKSPLYMGNSGTSMRLIAGILSAQQFDSVMTGDVSLSKRPMERVAKPLRTMGAKIQTTGEKGTAPISITGGQALQGIDYDMPVASAQVKSCLLLASLWAKGTTTIIEPEICRDHTEKMLTAFGYPVQVEKLAEGNKITITGGGELTACDIQVPADISSAGFFMVAGAIASEGSELTLEQVGINPTRTGIIDILKLMGADISLSNQSTIGAEPVADITVRASQLHGIHIPEELVPLAIDEFPILFVASSCATGQTVLTGAKELRVKESDRIAVMAEGLTTLGIDCTVTEDGIIIEGKGQASDNNSTLIFTGGQIKSYHDHRIAMSFTIASLRASNTIIIEGTETINTSFPNFKQLANKVGLNIVEE